MLLLSISSRSIAPPLLTSMPGKLTSFGYIIWDLRFLHSSFWFILVSGRRGRGWEGEKGEGWGHFFFGFTLFCHSSRSIYVHHPVNSPSFTVAALHQTLARLSSLFQTWVSRGFLLFSPSMLYYSFLAPYPCPSINYFQSDPLDIPLCSVRTLTDTFKFLDKSYNLLTFYFLDL